MPNDDTTMCQPGHCLVGKIPCRGGRGGRSEANTKACVPKIGLKTTEQMQCKVVS